MAFDSRPIQRRAQCSRLSAGWYLPRGTGEHVLVTDYTEFRGIALNGLFCADVLRPLELVLLTDFIYKYHPGYWYATM